MPITRNLRAQTVIAIKAPVPDGTSRPLIIIFSYSPRQTKHVCGVYTPMKALSASPLSTWAIFSVDSPTNWNWHRHRPNMSSDIVIQNFFVNHSIFILHSTPKHQHSTLIAFLPYYSLSNPTETAHHMSRIIQNQHYIGKLTIEWIVWVTYEVNIQYPTKEFSLIRRSHMSTLIISSFYSE